jgi:prepilin-type N-terminal cleavage/methylation domain-containing protein
MCRRSRCGFTLIELMVVLSVIGLLVAILIPAVQQARARARAAQCQNNLRQLGLALHSYESTHSLFPPSFVRQEDGNPPPPPVEFGALRYRSHWTGFHMLLPYLDQQNVYNQYDFRGTWLSSLIDPNDRSSWIPNRTQIPTLICPSAPRGDTVLGSSTTGGGPGSVITADGGMTQHGDAAAGAHWMSGAPTDYSFSHGADIISALPGQGEVCPGGLLHYWSQVPSTTRGAFGYSSSCRLSDITDGASNTFVIGEKTGSRLTYSGWNSSFPTLPVEYPWAMAAVAYFAPTGGEGVPGSAWVVGPFAVTHDIRLPDCPTAPPGSGQPFPINPHPRRMPASSDERPLYSFQSLHSQGAYFLFADGAVRFLNESIDQRVFEALSTIAGGETNTGDAF